MSQECTVVFTAKSVERILHEGGSAAWHLDRNHARRCAYAVCTRNARADWVEGQEPHGTAFLVGRVADVLAAPGYEKDEGRYLVQFSEYARVDMPKVWQGNRNPVRYATLDELGIDLSKLKWEPMPERAQDIRSERSAISGPAPLTIAEAKQGLSLKFGVPAGAIEISIRG